MKNIIVLYLAVLSVVVSNCDNNSGRSVNKSGLNQSDTGTVEIVFSEYEHNFGKVREGEKIAYTFNFLNKGTSDLLVSSALTSCGCTVSNYDTKPISPGEIGTLEVVFDTSGRNGLQTKTITVKSNASTPVVLLRISAEVITSNN